MQLTTIRERSSLFSGQLGTKDGRRSDQAGSGHVQANYSAYSGKLVVQIAHSRNRTGATLA